jgi:hypothetical protein
MATLNLRLVDGRQVSSATTEVVGLRVRSWAMWRAVCFTSSQIQFAKGLMAVTERWVCPGRQVAASRARSPQPNEQQPTETALPSSRVGPWSDPRLWISLRG